MLFPSLKLPCPVSCVVIVVVVVDLGPSRNHSLRGAALHQTRLLNSGHSAELHSDVSFCSVHSST